MVWFIYLALNIFKLLHFSEESYPYISGETSEAAYCGYDANTMEKKAVIRGYQSLPKNQLEPILNHVTDTGPLSVLVYANSNWKDYEKGVFDGCSYNESLSINHAVQVVLVMSSCVQISGIIKQLLNKLIENELVL